MVLRPGLDRMVLVITQVTGGRTSVALSHANRRGGLALPRSIFDRRRLLATALLVGAIVAGPTLAASPIETNADAEGLMLRGYDPVAYFTLGAPTPGSAAITAEHAGATYRFASEEHRELFLANPEAYVPAYGGFCAFGTAMGYKVDADPEAWSIVDDRLFVNLDRGVQRRWQGNPSGFIASADHNWPLIRDLDAQALQSTQPDGLRLGAN